MTDLEKAFEMLKNQLIEKCNGILSTVPSANKVQCEEIVKSWINHFAVKQINDITVHVKTGTTKSILTAMNVWYMSNK
nr:MAG TPA: hypothetical protein [Caudoviricetes sp.]